MTPEVVDPRVLRRYEQNVVRAGSSVCWGWNGATRNGYGTLTVGHDGHIYAHRVAMMLKSGAPLPDGLFVCHHCDNKACTNPDHLYLGTQFDNGRDIRERATSRKTHCRRGHEFTAENTYWHRRTNAKNGQEYDARICRACQSMRGKRRSA